MEVSVTSWWRNFSGSGICRPGGKRHLDGRAKGAEKAARAAREFRLRFLRGLKPEHPLYGSEEARIARGEMVKEQK